MIRRRTRDFISFTKSQAENSAGRIMPVMTGLVTSVDKDKYQVKVMLYPVGIETGWLALGTVYAGNGFGLVALPDIDTEVTVIFEHGDVNNGKVICCHFNDTDPPPAINPGEAILKHKSGSVIKFSANGDVDLTVTGATQISSTGNITVNSSGILNATSSGVMNLSGSSVNIAGGGAAVARVGDSVDPVTHKILTGSAKTFSG